MNQYRALSGRVRYLSANLPQRVTAGPQLSEFFISRPHDSDISTRMNIAIGEPGLATLVQDNLNTHTPASLYEAFPADEARRLVERFEWHYTPKHGSWLNLAESELGVLSSQCLDRRMSDKRFLKSEVAAWEANRNKKHAKANWRFTTESARVKLKKLYPSF
jgi:DDE superfamily endonuclease